MHDEFCLLWHTTRRIAKAEIRRRFNVSSKGTGLVACISEIGIASNIVWALRTQAA